MSALWIGRAILHGWACGPVEMALPVFPTVAHARELLFVR